MGPRPDGRGTGFERRYGPDWKERLQWGRDRMAAERRIDEMRAEAKAGFNGAATGWPRNAVCTLRLDTP